MIRKTEGFTLLELIISIAVGTMITIAATTTLLLGLRINAGSTENVKQQNTTSVLVQVLENVTEAGPIKDPDGSPKIIGTNNQQYVEFVKNAGEDTGVIKLNGNVFMENVQSFTADVDNSLLTVEITVDGKRYTASIYCRLNPTPEDNT